MVFNLGMGIRSTTITSQFDSHVDDLIANNITYLRIDIPDYQNSTSVAQSKAAVIRAVAKGAKVIWGVSSNKKNNPAYEITAANWATFKAAILAAAQWAQDNGVYEFQLGNEEETHNDDTTLTDAQLLINLKDTATEAQVIFTNGNISYSCGGGSAIDDWIAAGKGDLDILASNIYRNPANWQDLMSNLISAFGTDGTYLTEFSLNWISLDTYSTDENIQATGILEMMNYADDLGFKRMCFFNYISDDFGARKADGTYRLLWNILTSFSAPSTTTTTGGGFASSRTGGKDEEFKLIKPLKSLRSLKSLKSLSSLKF
jgi:hypothetical protein